MLVFQTFTSRCFRVIAHAHYHLKPWWEVQELCGHRQKTSVRILLLMRMCFDPVTLIGLTKDLRVSSPEQVIQVPLLENP